MLLPALVIAAWTLIHFIYFGDNRFHFPVFPFLAIFSAVAALKAVRMNIQRNEATGNTEPGDAGSSM